jgi:hypothetical protein
MLRKKTSQSGHSLKLTFKGTERLILRIIHFTAFNWLASLQELGAEKGPNCKQSASALHTGCPGHGINLRPSPIKIVAQDFQTLFYVIPLPKLRGKKFCLKVLICTDTFVHYHSGGSMKLNACILILTHMVYL